MMRTLARFNIYLCVLLGLLLATGCQTDREKKKKDKEATVLELHLEVNRDGAKDNEPVPIFREHPVYVNANKSAIVDSADLDQALVVDDMGGFSIKLKFNWRGTQLLQGATTANRGKRIAVFATFGQSRWLASPVINKPIADGVFTFTPDATREEAERIVRGLNNVAAKLKKEDK